MNNISLIWDLDGTLLDSYHVILTGLCTLCEEYHIPYSREAINQEIITFSSKHFLHQLEAEYGLDFDEIKDRCSEINSHNNKDITLMLHAKQCLQSLKELGVKHYVFTHRGKSTEEALRNVGIYDFFEEIINALSGFPRKPAPDAVIYLVQKHLLDPNNTYYVGDRSLDIECAVNAGIKSILYLPEGSITVPTQKETYIVKDLMQIAGIFKDGK